MLFTGRFISYPSIGCKKKLKVNYEHLLFEPSYSFLRRVEFVLTSPKAQKKIFLLKLHSTRGHLTNRLFLCVRWSFRSRSTVKRGV